MADLISTENYVECPFVIVKIGDTTFGSYSREVDKRILGSTLKVTYPNCMKGISVVKVNGEVNTYTINMVYAITENDDPNMLEKVFSSIRNKREMTLTYGDWNSPSNIYKNETALVTGVKSQLDVRNSKITYTITGVSNALALSSAVYDFPAREAKPSDIIRELLYTASYGLLKVFTGMINKSAVNNAGLLASDDQKVFIEAKTGTNVIDYINYLTSYMMSSSSKGNLGDSIYQMAISDDSSNSMGGPYFQVKKISVNTSRSSADNAWEIDVGFPGNNQVMSFSVDNDESWSLLYDYQDKISQSSYSYKIDNNGDLQVTETPSIMRSRSHKNLPEKNKTWWTKMTQFPITATLTLKGLVRPTLLMDYIKVNVLFYGRKHIATGIYVITKQEDTINESGYRTTLTLLRVGGE